MNKIDLTNNWVEITDKKCIFQNSSKWDIDIIESSDGPEDEFGFKLEPNDFGMFEPNDNKLWAKSDYSNCSIIFSEV